MSAAVENKSDVIKIFLDTVQLRAHSPLCQALSVAAVEGNLEVVSIFMKDGRCASCYALLGAVEESNLKMVHHILSYPATDPSCLKNLVFKTALKKNLEVAKVLFDDRRFALNEAASFAIREFPVGLLNDIHRDSSGKSKDLLANFDEWFLKQYKQDFKFEFDYSKVLKATLNSSDKIEAEEKIILASLFDGHSLTFGESCKVGLDFIDYSNMILFFASILECAGRSINEKVLNILSEGEGIEALYGDEVSEEIRAASIKNITDGHKLASLMLQWKSSLDEKLGLFSSTRFKELLFSIGQLDVLSRFPSDQHAKITALAANSKLNFILLSLDAGDSLPIPLMGRQHAALAMFTRTSPGKGTYRVYNSGDGTVGPDPDRRIPAWEEFYEVPDETVLEIITRTINHSEKVTFRSAAYPSDEFKSKKSELTVLPQRTGSCAPSSILQMLLLETGRPLYTVIKTMGYLYLLDQIYSSLDSEDGFIVIGGPFNYRFKPYMRSVFVFARQTKMLERGLIKQLERVSGLEKEFCQAAIEAHLSKHA